MLDKPPHIANANIAGTPLRFRWDEWSVTAAYQPADPALTARMAALSHRANVAMCTAMAEWVVWRFERLSTDTAPYEFIEAAWAAGVHTAYARYVEFRDDDWRGVVRGPMRMSMEILVDLIWGLADTTPGENAAWMSNLAELVLPDPPDRSRSGERRVLGAWSASTLAPPHPERSCSATRSTSARGCRGSSSI